MTLTYGTAKDEIKTHVYSSWVDGLANGYNQRNQSTGAVELVSPLVFKTRGYEDIYVPEMRFAWLQNYLNVDTGQHFAHFRMATVDRRNNTMRGSRPECGVRYTHRGIITVGLYLSKSAFKEEDDTFLVEMMLNIFQRPKTTEDQVWFRDPHPEPQKELDSFFLNTIFVRYQFDEIT